MGLNKRVPTKLQEQVDREQKWWSWLEGIARERLCPPRQIFKNRHRSATLKFELGPRI